MKTVDDELVAAAKAWIERQHAAGKPGLRWLDTTHMHCRTHTKPESVGQAGRWPSRYHDTMNDHDENVRGMLNLLDTLGVANDTIVLYSTDDGPHMNTSRDGAITPFHSEKDTSWEGLPCARGAAMAGQGGGRRGLQRAASFTIDQAMEATGADIGHRREGAGHRASRRAEVVVVLVAGAFVMGLGPPVKGDTTIAIPT
jgi:hypothetical protein